MRDCLFYSSELVCALAYLHAERIVYRDLNPSNILIDADGHLKLVDFGLAKVLADEHERTTTLCGTPEYLAPEVILGKGYGREVDWWALGIVMFELATGMPPFFSSNPLLIYQQILSTQVAYPPGFPPKARTVVAGLLRLNPERRLCGLVQLKAQAYFAPIDFDLLLSKRVPAPWKPAAAGRDSASHSL